MRIKVSYIGDLDEVMDKEIEECMKSIKCNLYATGYNYKRYERDLLFMKSDKPKEKENKI